MFLIKLQGNKCCMVLEHTINVYYICIVVCCLKHIRRMERKNKYEQYTELKREDELLSQRIQLPCSKGKCATSLDTFLLYGVKKKVTEAKLYLDLDFSTINGSRPCSRFPSLSLASL